MRGRKNPPIQFDPTPDGVPLTFDLLAQAYLEDYVLQRYRSLNTARPRVEHLRAFFGGWPVERITSDSVRQYQLHRRGQGVEAATVNRETSALSRMFQLALRRGQLERMPLFPERLEENPPRDGFFEHADAGFGAPGALLESLHALLEAPQTKVDRHVGSELATFCGLLAFGARRSGVFGGVLFDAFFGGFAFAITGFGAERFFGGSACSLVRLCAGDVAKENENQKRSEAAASKASHGAHCDLPRSFREALYTSPRQRFC